MARNPESGQPDPSLLDSPGQEMTASQSTHAEYAPRGGRTPYSRQIQQRGRLGTPPANCRQPAICPNDRERPRPGPQQLWDTGRPAHSRQACPATSDAMATGMRSAPRTDRHNCRSRHGKCLAVMKSACRLCAIHPDSIWVTTPSTDLRPLATRTSAARRRTRARSAQTRCPAGSRRSSGRRRSTDRRR